MDNWSLTLKEIVKILNQNYIPYILIASGSLKVLGVKIKPYDIDIFTSAENVKKCFELFSDIKTSDLYYYEDKDGKYLEFQASKNNTPIEFCEIKSLENIKKIYVDFEGVNVCIAESSLEDELKANIAKGRKETVQAIEEFRSKTNF